MPDLSDALARFSRPVIAAVHNMGAEILRRLDQMEEDRLMADQATVDQITQQIKDAVASEGADIKAAIDEIGARNPGVDLSSLKTAADGLTNQESGFHKGLAAITAPAVSGPTIASPASTTTPAPAGSAAVAGTAPAGSAAVAGTAPAGAPAAAAGAPVAPTGVATISPTNATGGVDIGATTPPGGGAFPTGNANPAGPGGTTTTVPGTVATPTPGSASPAPGQVPPGVPGAIVSAQGTAGVAEGAPAPGQATATPTPGTTPDGAPVSPLAASQSAAQPAGAAPADTPVTGRTMYESSGSGEPDPAKYTPASMKTVDGEMLYFAKADTEPTDRKGESTDMKVYDGPTTQASAAA